VTALEDRNIVQEEEQKLKYKTSCIEIKRMWNLKCVIGATGIVTKSLKTNLEAIPGIQEDRGEKACD